MRLSLFLVLFLAVLAVSLAKKVHRRKHEKKHFLKVVGVDKDGDVEKDVLDLLADDEEDEDKKKKKLELQNLEDENHIEGGYTEDLCAKHHCGAGRECELNPEGKPHCVCVKHCPQETDERRKVCSNHNETWNSDCELYRMRCVCNEGEDECEHNKYKHAHVDYYGICRDLSPCTEDEMADFPRRMREWLFNVMQDLARRHELSNPALELEQEAEKQLNRKWVNAVIWKFCDLDVHPHDRVVSRHELFPIRAPLMAMEHCIAPFLDSCDANNDHKITLMEWGTCLGLEEDEIEDKCIFLVENRRG